MQDVLLKCESHKKNYYSNAVGDIKILIKNINKNSIRHYYEA